MSHPTGCNSRKVANDPSWLQKNFRISADAKWYRPKIITSHEDVLSDEKLALNVICQKSCQTIRKLRVRNEKALNLFYQSIKSVM